MESLAAELEERSKEGLEAPENVEKMRHLLFEVEVAQGYLAKVFKAWQARQQVHSEDSCR